MAIDRSQLVVGGRVFWKHELSRGNAPAEIILKPAEVLEVSRAAARVRLLEGKGKIATIRFSHLEPDLAYLAALEGEKEARTAESGADATRPRRGRRPKAADNVIVTSRFIRPTANANAQDLAAVAAEEAEATEATQLPFLEAHEPPKPQSHLTVVPQIRVPVMRPPEPPKPEAPKPEPVDAELEEFAVLREMHEALLETMNEKLRACDEEREALHEKRREVEIALEANAKRKMALAEKRDRMQAFLSMKE